MTKDKTITSVEQFAASFQGFLKHIEALAPEEEPVGPPLLSHLIAGFLDKPVHMLAIAKSSLLVRELPNIQLACTELFASSGWESELAGYTVEHDNDFGMASVLMPRNWDPVRVGAAVYNTVALPRGQLRCLERGVYFVQAPGFRAALLIHAHRSRYDAYLRVEAAAATIDEAEALIAHVESKARAIDALRGSMLSLADNAEDVKFLHLAPVTREELILPDPVRTAIERTTIGFSEHSGQLLKAGRHVKRGLLLHGLLARASPIPSAISSGRCRAAQPSC